MRTVSSRSGQVSSCSEKKKLSGRIDATTLLKKDQIHYSHGIRLEYFWPFSTNAPRNRAKS